MDNYFREKKEEQLVDLINLAEDISGDIKTMYEKKNRIVLAAFISIILSIILALFALNNTLPNNGEQIFTLSFLLISISLGISIYSLKSLYDGLKLNKEIEYETYILGGLLNQMSVTHIRGLIM